MDIMEGAVSCLILLLLLMADTNPIKTFMNYFGLEIPVI